MKYFFSIEAIMQVLNECYSMESRSETGGIFVGPRDAANVITHAIPSSVYAERGLTTYFQTEEDVKLLNKKLRKFQVRGEDFKGYWHRHPSGYTCLSPGDLGTAKGILQDPSYKINNNLLMTVITEDRQSNLPVFSYNVILDHGEVSLEDVQMVILPKCCIKSVWLNPNIIRREKKGACFESYNLR